MSVSNDQLRALLLRNEQLQLQDAQDGAELNLAEPPRQEADAGAADGAPPQAPADGAGPSQRPPRPANYSRKSRSLGLLCENFLARFGREAGSIINVDTAAKELGVERRRIYDILNVLHSLGVTEKRMKGQYVWKGLSLLPASLEELRTEAALEVAAPAAPEPADAERREKSMVRLTQRFIQMFMLSQAPALGLEEAAAALLGASDEAGQMKTKVRRLYDIANILCALGMIEKAPVREGGKPGFRWLGTDGMMARSVAAGGAAAAMADEMVGAAPGTTALLLADAGMVSMFNQAGVPLSMPMPPMLFPGGAPGGPEQPLLAAAAQGTSGGAGRKRARTERGGAAAGAAPSHHQQQLAALLAGGDLPLPLAPGAAQISHPLKRFLEMESRAAGGGGGAPPGGDLHLPLDLPPELTNPALWAPGGWPQAMNPALYGAFPWAGGFPGGGGGEAGGPAPPPASLPFPMPFPPVFPLPAQAAQEGATPGGAPAPPQGGPAPGGGAPPPEGMAPGAAEGDPASPPIQAYAANVQQAYASYYASYYSWMKSQGEGGDGGGGELPPGLSARELAEGFPSGLPMMVPPEAGQMPQQQVQPQQEEPPPFQQQQQQGDQEQLQRSQRLAQQPESIAEPQQQHEPRGQPQYAHGQLGVVPSHDQI